MKSYDFTLHGMIIYYIIFCREMWFFKSNFALLNCNISKIWENYAVAWTLRKSLYLKHRIRNKHIKNKKKLLYTNSSYFLNEIIFFTFFEMVKNIKKYNAFRQIIESTRLEFLFRAFRDKATRLLCNFFNIFF